MPAVDSRFPDTAQLAAGLASVFGGHDAAVPCVTILNREPMVTMTFPSEIVTCRLPSGREINLFCKYEGGINHDAYGHRGGVAYEAEVYRQILQPLQTTTPELLGIYRDPATEDIWLILQYLERGTLLRDLILDLDACPQPTEMGLAARWIGAFHAVARPRPGRKSKAFLKQYDAGYYQGWVWRTMEFAGGLHQEFPWLGRLGLRAGELLEPLLTAQPAVIHGEFYQNNIVIRDRLVYPTDWESAALAAGEIDLAALTDGPWAAEIVQQCVEEYQRARWPGGPPKMFGRALAAARLYLHFRWLGEQPDWTTREKSRWRFDELRRAAEQLDIL